MWPSSMQLLAAAAVAMCMASGLISPTRAQPVSRRPALGWRSWYASSAHGLQGGPTQAFMVASMDAMADRSRLVDGVPTSLADLGFTRASVDDGYMACSVGANTSCGRDCGGVNGSFHDARGRPVLNKTSFPDVRAMVAHAHSLNLTAGWYTNNFNGEACEGGWSKTAALHALHMSGEAEWMADMGFDEVKVDSGGKFNDMTAWQQALNQSGRAIATENCHQGGELPNASWCPFQQWRTSGDPKSIGWQREMIDTAQLLHLARRGCWAYPGYIIYGADAGNSSLVDARSSFGAHAIISSPLILSIDITDPTKHPCVGKMKGRCTNQLDLYWDLLSNREALAVNQNWAGSVGALLRKWNPAHENASSPMYVWALPCNATDVASAVWKVDATTQLVTVEWHGEIFCLEHLPPSALGGSSVVGVRACNVGSPTQAFHYNATSADIYHVVPAAHGNSKAEKLCLQVVETSLKGAPILGPFVTYMTCSWNGGMASSKAARRWNLTSAGELVSQQGQQVWKDQHHYNRNIPARAKLPPQSADGPCLVPQRGPPNKFGPLQLWSKPQPGGAVAVFVQSTGTTWGNEGQAGATATIQLSELPGMAPGTTKVKVRDIWGKQDLPDATKEVRTDPIDAGDSRFYLLTPLNPRHQNET